MEAGHERRSGRSLHGETLRVHRNVERPLECTPGKEGSEESSERMAETNEGPCRAITHQGRLHQPPASEPREEACRERHRQDRSERRTKEREPKSTVPQMKLRLDVRYVRYPGCKEQTVDEENRRDRKARPSSA